MKAMKSYSYKILLLTASVLIIAASCSVDTRPLPIYGQRYFDGKDTVYHTIAAFSLVDQDSQTVTNATLNGKIYVADFFFTQCPTICPTTSAQLLRVSEAVSGFDDVMVVSHTIDPDYDNVSRLHQFAEDLGAGKNWRFLTGVRDSIMHLAQTSYLSTALADASEPGGYVHSGAFLLIDRKGRIRGSYDGTNPDEVNQLIGDLKKLRTLE